MVGAANKGHDSDTVAAIAGGLAGLACGFEGLPREYVNAILQKEELLKLARELKNLRMR